MLQSVATPTSAAEALGLLSHSDAARIIAGGTVVMPELNYGTDDFKNLVSLRHAGLSGIAIQGKSATIGAATKLSDIEDDDRLQFLRPALDSIASPTIRNMATIGGNLFVKQPYGDFAVCLIALGATVAIAGAKNTREDSVENIVKSGLKAGEIVTEIRFDIPRDGTFKFTKAGRKALNSAAVVTVAAVIEAEGGNITGCRIALGAVAGYPLRAASVEKALQGKPLDRTTVEAAAKEAANDIDPADDAYATAWYRRRVTPVHIRRALVGE